ncbi:hypothetical protein ACIQZB_28835 [Streptomyces sp. NPDC097727]|uniref:hypothetical protein n=1 Tax=Streptomyces sp. NPDC097727 TaxID=3366092 RepID=UPI00381D7CA1
MARHVHDVRGDDRPLGHRVAEFAEPRLGTGTAAARVHDQVCRKGLLGTCGPPYPHPDGAAAFNE